MKQPHTVERDCRYCFVRCAIVAVAIFFLASVSLAQTPPPQNPSLAWAQSLQRDPALRAEFAHLLELLRHGVQFPPARDHSRLLPLQQDSTIFYAAFPNYGEASHQALTIFQHELQQSAALRDWWQHGEMATFGPSLENALEKYYQLSRFVGDEITLSVGTEGRQGPSLLVLAEIKKPGLQDFLQPMAKNPTGKSKPLFRVFDKQQLATAIDTPPPQEPVVLVRPDFAVATLDLGELKRLSAHLDAQRGDFISTPFGQRIGRAYQGGATFIGAADLQAFLHLLPPDSKPRQVLSQRSGFADMKYLVWKHASVAGEAASQIELSFTGPRHGMAAWLAAPGPLESLDFVSPKAMLVAALRLQNPAQIFDDAREWSTASNPAAFATIAQMEQAMKLSVKDDLLSLLTGEVTFEIDDFTVAVPEWRAILKVSDPDHLQASLSKLQTTIPVEAQHSEDAGVTYHTLRIPKAKKNLEIAYAFVDGYLLIASSRDGVADAVRIHKNGESLAKSTKFLASLPPGYGPDASALFYEDPMKMVAMNIRRLWPDMAESFAQSSAGAPPVTVCAYGDESAIREISRSSGMDPGAFLIGAAIAIPNLLRARIAANESSAVATLHTVNTAQITYFGSYPRRGYAPDLATLGPDPAGSQNSTPRHANLIDSALGDARCTSGSWCLKTGFRFSVAASCKKPTCQDFVVVATPESPSTGSRNFCSTSDAVIRVQIGPPLTAPPSVSECRAWPPLQ